MDFQKAMEMGIVAALNKEGIFCESISYFEDYCFIRLVKYHINLWIWQNFISIYADDQGKLRFYFDIADPSFNPDALIKEIIKYIKKI